MTARPCYFVVAKVNDLEVAALYWDELPMHPIRKRLYVVRLDQLNPKLCEAQLADLYTVFCHLRKRGKLPPGWEPPPRPKSERAKHLLGHREYHPRRFMPDLPFDESQIKAK